ncbi:hypothetical protein HDV00_010358 [Rhizophlyctis rosea]|nr:hypothetical protein HDV00_010358 [Rhizophlyctis rosea]
MHWGNSNRNTPPRGDAKVPAAENQSMSSPSNLPAIAPQGEGHRGNHMSNNSISLESFSANDTMCVMVDGNPNITFNLPHAQASVCGPYCVSHGRLKIRINVTELQVFEVRRNSQTGTAKSSISPQTFHLHPLYTLSATTFTFNTNLLAYIDPDNGNDTHILRVIRIANQTPIASLSNYGIPEFIPTLHLTPTHLAEITPTMITLYTLGTLRIRTRINLEVADIDDLSRHDNWQLEDDVPPNTLITFPRHKPFLTSDGSLIVIPNAEGGDPWDRSHPPIHYVVDPAIRKIWRVCAGWRTQQRGFLAIIRSRKKIMGEEVGNLGDWDVVWRKVGKDEVPDGFGDFWLSDRMVL